MKQYVWIGVMVGWLGFAASGCTVKQQESVLGAVGTAYSRQQRVDVRHQP